MAAQSDLKTLASSLFRDLQSTICTAIERADGRSLFRQDEWKHPSGGGGVTRVLEGGEIFEKAGVNFSAVTSRLTDRLASRLKIEPQEIFATGISLVIHPHSPMVPTVHMNLRYLEPAGGGGWFGGGADLTPYYLFEEDARHFHGMLKTCCDRYDPSWYPRFKRDCDEYFLLKHRGEARGIGGIFYDYERERPSEFLEFAGDVGRHFSDAYLPIVERRRNTLWGEREKEWQLIRRGRYVEFNLVHDRGTLFGLETGGRTESILMSLPPEVRWTYAHEEPGPGTAEASLLSVLRGPREWA